MSWLYLTEGVNDNRTHLSPQSNPRLQLLDDINSDSDDDSSNSNTREEQDDEDVSSTTDGDGNNSGSDDEDEEDGPIDTHDDLDNLTVPVLKERLRARGLPVSGRKADLINRLLTGESAKKVKAWQKSEARDLLVKLIYSNKPGIDRMSAEDIYESNETFRDYQLDKFRGYLLTIRASAKKHDEIASVSEREIWADMTNFPRKPNTIRGYPHWDGHPASNLLEKDVKDGTAEEMKPSALYDTKDEYKQFPLEVFRDHIYQEKRKQREEAGWVFRRNNKGRKKHEAKVKAMTDDWDRIQYKKDYNSVCEMMSQMTGGNANSADDEDV